MSKNRQNETPFNYNLKRMQAAVKSPTVTLPKNIVSPEKILEFMLKSHS